MKTVVEAFLVRIEADRVRWQRRSLLLGPHDVAEQPHGARHGVTHAERAARGHEQARPPLTPDQAVQRLVNSCRGMDADGPPCCLSHSTSWRFELPDTVVLTYIVCLPRHGQAQPPIQQKGRQAVAQVRQAARSSPLPTDALLWQDWQELLVHDLQLAHGAAPHAPAPARIEARLVLSHALRHLAFLAHGPAVNAAVSRALGPQARRFLSRVMPALAGQLRPGREGV